METKYVTLSGAHIGLGNVMSMLGAGIATAKRLGRKFVLTSIMAVQHSTFDSWSVITSQMEYSKVRFRPDDTMLIYDKDWSFDTLKWDDNSSVLDNLSYQHDKTLIMLCGYFQGDCYLSGAEQEIYDHYKPKAAIRAKLLSMYPEVDNYYFMHIRRGNCVGTKFDIPLDEYYPKCIDMFREKYGNEVKILCFSDDPEWDTAVKWKVPSNIVKVDNTLNELECLWLMSLCGRGGICANSTFSWWGAWLGNRTQCSDGAHREKLYTWPKAWDSDRYVFGGMIAM